MRFSVEQFEKSCGCRSAGECSHNATSEIDALCALVDAFAEEMKAKLTRCAMEKGKSGWDDPRWRAVDITEALAIHVEKGDPIDVGNLAAFLWNRSQ